MNIGTVISIIIVTIIVTTFLIFSKVKKYYAIENSITFTTTNLTVILDPSVSWELDFILNELLPKDLVVIKPNNDEFTRLSYYNEYNLIGNSILVFN